LTLVPDAPHRSLPDIPLALSNVVMRCLEKDSAKRFQTAGEMLAALDELPAMAGSGSVMAPARTRRRWVFPAAAALLLVAAIAFANAIIGDRAVDDRIARVDDTSGTDANVNADLRRRDTTALANIDNDNGRGTSLPLVITREESLAIAAAIQQRSQPTPAAPRAPTPPPAAATAQGAANADAQAQRAAGAQALETSRVFIATPGTQVTVDRDMLLKEVQRVFADSFAMAFARVDSTLASLPRMVRMEGTVPRVPTTAITPLIGPPDGGTFRVVVTPFSPRAGVPPELARYGADVADALRGALARVERIDVVGPELTERATRGSSDRMVAGWRLRADYLVTGAYSVRADSVRIIVQFTDVRTGRFTRADQAVIPVADARSGLESATSRVLAWLDTARTMPGRHAPPRGVFVQPGRSGSKPPGDVRDRDTTGR
jgi:TolB-like protein